MKSALLLLPVVLVSLAAYVVGARAVRLPRAALGIAVRRTLECLGAAAVFFVLDLVIGSTIILGLRAFTPYFMPLYIMVDTTLIPLALFQGLAFWWWMRCGRSDTA